MADNIYTSPSRGRLGDPTQKTSSQMQGLLSEFRGLYESRLHKLDEAEKAGEDTHRVIITVLSESIHCVDFIAMSCS